LSGVSSKHKNKINQIDQTNLSFDLPADLSSETLVKEEAHVLRPVRRSLGEVGSLRRRRIGEGGACPPTCPPKLNPYEALA